MGECGFGTLVHGEMKGVVFCIISVPSTRFCDGPRRNVDAVVGRWLRSWEGGVWGGVRGMEGGWGELG